MRVLFCLSFILLQGFLSVSGQLPQEWTTMNNNELPDVNYGTVREDRNCTDEECTRMGLMIKYSITQSVPACDDFYTHACGGWISRNPLGGRAIVDQYTSIKADMYNDLRGYLMDDAVISKNYLENKVAKKFYASCVDERARKLTGLKELKHMVDSSGGWPLLSYNQTETYNQKWQNVHLRYSEKYDLPALFHIQVLPGRQNSKNHVITLSMPITEMHDLRNVKTPKTPHSSTSPKMAYQKLIRQVANLLKRRSPKVRRIFRQRIHSIIAFEEGLKKLSDSHSRVNFHHDTSYKMTTIKNLQNEWDTILMSLPTSRAIYYKMDWLETIRRMFAKSGARIEIYDNEVIDVEPGHFIKLLGRLLIRTDPATIVNYIHWNAIKNMLKYSGDKIEAMIHRYNEVVYGSKSTDPRSLECAKDFPLEHILTTRMRQSDDLKKQQDIILKMIYRVESAFFKEIVMANKLSGYERRTFLAKFSPHMNHGVGYPDLSQIVHPTFLSYSKLKVTRHNYFANMLRYKKFTRRKEFQKLRLPVDILVAEWPITPTEFIATYDDRTNSVILPAGLLKHPYMACYKVPAVQYGALGSTIGHEMTHSIDKEERLMDGLGEIEAKWSIEVSSLYKEFEDCYREQYNGSYTKLNTGERLPIDTDLTIREIIADNVGFRMAFRAFKQFREDNDFDVHLPNLLALGYTQEQIFFYSLAQSFCENPSDEYLRNVCATDEHPPSKIRINGALAGMKEFHDAFHCKNGDHMKMQEAKCSLW